jgi:hypothetical protein
MAVTLTLRQLFEFQADHPQEEVERIARIPVKHFNVLFCPLFGLQPLPAGTYPCTVVDSIRTFLMTMARHKNWFLLRINKFRWAYKKRRDFLIAVIHLHRDRWNAALQVWAAAESEQRATLTKFLRRMKEKDPAGASMPKQARRKSTKQTTWDAYGPAELAGVPVAKKKEAIVELHRRRLVDVTHALRAWLQQNTALQKEVKQISKQVAARWWKLDLSRRITPDIVPMATRLESLRTRALMNCFVKPRVQALAWRSVSAEELQSFYIQHNPLANDITAVVLQDPWVWQEVRRAQAAEAAEMTAAFRGSVGGKRQYVKQSIEPEPAEIPMFRQQMQNRMASYRFTSPSDTTDDTSDNTSENAPLLKVKGVRAQATGRRQTFCDTDSSGGSFGHDSSPENASRHRHSVEPGLTEPSSDIRSTADERRVSGEQRLPCPPSAQKSIFTDLKLCTDFSDAVDPPLDGCPLLVPGGTGVLRQAWANEGVRRGSSAILARRRGGLLSDRRDSSSQQDANSPQSPVNKSPEPLTPTILTVKPFSKLGTPKGGSTHKRCSSRSIRSSGTVDTLGLGPNRASTVVLQRTSPSAWAGSPTSPMTARSQPTTPITPVRMPTTPITVGCLPTTPITASRKEAFKMTLPLARLASRESVTDALRCIDEAP